MMGVTKAVLEVVIAKIGPPVIMNKEPLKMRQNPHMISCFLATRLVRHEQRPTIIERCVQPMAFPIDVEPRFICMQKRGVDQPLRGDREKLFPQEIVSLSVEIKNAATAQRDL